jgi:hypothetical protein
VECNVGRNSSSDDGQAATETGGREEGSPPGSVWIERRDRSRHDKSDHKGPG